jgi:hypothetical protein
MELPRHGGCAFHRLLTRGTEAGNRAADKRLGSASVTSAEPGRRRHRRARPGRSIAGAADRGAIAVEHGQVEGRSGGQRVVGLLTSIPAGRPLFVSGQRRIAAGIERRLTDGLWRGKAGDSGRVTSRPFAPRLVLLTLCTQPGACADRSAPSHPDRVEPAERCGRISVRPARYRGVVSRMGPSPGIRRGSGTIRLCRIVFFATNREGKASPRQSVGFFCAASGLGRTSAAASAASPSRLHDNTAQVRHAPTAKVGPP